MVLLIYLPYNSIQTSWLSDLCNNTMEHNTIATTSSMLLCQEQCFPNMGYHCPIGFQKCSHSESCGACVLFEQISQHTKPTRLVDVAKMSFNKISIFQYCTQLILFFKINLMPYASKMIRVLPHSVSAFS